MCGGQRQRLTSHLLEPSTKLICTFMDLLLKTEAISPTDGTCSVAESCRPVMSELEMCLKLRESDNVTTLWASLALQHSERSEAKAHAQIRGLYLVLWYLPGFAALQSSLIIDELREQVGFGKGASHYQ